MESNNLHKMILHRSYDWFLVNRRIKIYACFCHHVFAYNSKLKYNSLLHQNGQCYFLSSDGFPYTRQWIDFFYGVDMAHSMFEFSQAIRDLALNDREMSLLFPLQMCHPGRSFICVIGMYLLIDF
jgi:hypothetical protein